MGSSILIAIGSVIGASVALQLLIRASRRSTIRLGDDIGDLLIYPLLLKIVGWLGLSGAVALFCFAGYALWQSPEIRAGHPGAVIAYLMAFCLTCGGFGWLGIYLIRKGATRFELTPTGITERRGRFSLCISWSEVTSVRLTWAGTRLVICNPQGQEIKVDNSIVGMPTLLQYLQRHLSPNLSSVADPLRSQTLRRTQLGVK